MNITKGWTRSTVINAKDRFRDRWEQVQLEAIYNEEDMYNSEYCYIFKQLFERNRNFDTSNLHEMADKQARINVEARQKRLNQYLAQRGNYNVVQIK